jgi:hypothetical protein
VTTLRLERAALSRLLHVTGYSGRAEPVPEVEIGTALVEPLHSGKIVVIWRVGVRCYKLAFATIPLARPRSVK